MTAGYDSYIHMVIQNRLQKMVIFLLVKSYKVTLRYEPHGTPGHNCVIPRVTHPTAAVKRGALEQIGAHTTFAACANAGHNMRMQLATHLNFWYELHHLATTTACPTDRLMTCPQLLHLITL